MSANARAYDEAEKAIEKKGLDTNVFAQRFIGAISGAVDSGLWKLALYHAAASMKNERRKK